MSDRGPIKLDTRNLARLSPRVQVPTYDRRGANGGLVHIGVGSFFRAHQAVYLDDLLQQSGNSQWGYCGIGLLPHDAGVRDALLSQDCLYTVLERSAGGDRARVIGALLDFLHAPRDPETVLKKLASPRTRIVSLTITEGGYYVNKGTGEFNDTHPDILHDLKHPQQPRCSFGVLLEALDHRRKRGLEPFTLMSCDNLQHNGDLTRKMLLAFAECRDPQLAGWLGEHCAFPNSMVDRITPATTDEHRALLREEFNLDDAWPVVTESFTQWIIEDNFPGGRPAWETVGAQMTTDVLPYEKMKLRLLNASHQALCYIGMLLGYEFAHEAMQDARIQKLVRTMMDGEVTPLLTTPAGIDLEAYKTSLVERFSNPNIRDQLSRIGSEGSAKIPVFVLPSIVEGLRQGTPVKLLCFTVAAWLRSFAGTDDTGRPISIVDPMAERLREQAGSGWRDADVMLGMHDIFNEELLSSPAFTSEINRALAGFYDQGAERTLADYTGA
ncbi:MAG: mannitol dehydrogenase family protein [Proteobacteria bacterium]|nr:MAG: mannitol dehydrogenase family protein [Pseudomonadota bacterium]